MYIFTDDLREFETNGSVNLCTSVSGTTQSGRTSAMTSNAESEVLSTYQGKLCAYAWHLVHHVRIVCVSVSGLLIVID